ncbi:response regulator transcription factor [Thioalkalivibrio sp. HK1]|uniref:response regulator transcription factor n=1 Tax=Thioalkalivibrio sp. HK1 TaxID=1469245 RepID=UPI0005709830|nr:response regulator transcription factor [Thioalkalivibrio sp. HK1]
MLATPSGSRETVLVIEDNRDIAEMVCAFLERRGYRVDYAANGITGLNLGSNQEVDAIVLDLMLPGLDGLDLCRRLREDARSDVPILMLTARDTLEDKIAGLDAGADDYLIKPFEIEELEARLRALLRRRKGLIAPQILQVGDLILDPATLRVERAGVVIPITPIGFKILSLLMRASPRVVGRREIESEIWGDFPPDSDALRSHLYILRQAVDRPFARPLIHTRPGTGYRLSE